MGVNLPSLCPNGGVIIKFTISSPPFCKILKSIVFGDTFQSLGQASDTLPLRSALWALTYTEICFALSSEKIMTLSVILAVTSGRISKGLYNSPFSGLE